MTDFAVAAQYVGRSPTRTLDSTAARAAGDRWARIDVVAETGSTNADLAEDHSARIAACSSAEHQRAGRGRLDRFWESPPRRRADVLRAAAAVRAGATWGWLPLLAGVALHDAVPVAPA